MLYWPFSLYKIYTPENRNERKRINLTAAAAQESETKNRSKCQCLHLYYMYHLPFEIARRKWSRGVSAQHSKTQQNAQHYMRISFQYVYRVLYFHVSILLSFDILFFFAFAS